MIQKTMTQGMILQIARRGSLVNPLSGAVAVRKVMSQTLSTKPKEKKERKRAIQAHQDRLPPLLAKTSNDSSRNTKNNNINRDVVNE